jgi:rare lipoprotein A
MANGQPFDQAALTVASPDLPLGACLWLFNPLTRRDIAARVTDRGPYVEGRTLDVSAGVAEALGFRERGLARLVAYPVPTDWCGGNKHEH